MQNANQILQALHKLGQQRAPLTRVYRSLFSEDLFLHAYAKIARNQGALTAGTDHQTADGMSLDRIHTIIEALRHERYQFKPARRVHIPKQSGGTRPLDMPNFADKLVQEVLRLLLTAYYEPRFRESSHGFRPERGCHTALTRIKQSFIASTWFIEGDIQRCFDSLDRNVLLAILARDIHDGRLLNLLRLSLQAGVMEGWRYHQTYSGAPQGSILSPLLANIYLHELDTFIEDTLIPQYTRGERRGRNPLYERYRYRIRCAHLAGDHELADQLRQKRRQLPVLNTHDPDFRRLHYIRYADDFILSFIGPKAEAEQIKSAIGTFLREHLRLELNPTKTLITHARTEHAQFLGYAISIYHNNDAVTDPEGTSLKQVRHINGKVRLGIPYGLVDKLAQRYQQDGKPSHEAALLTFPDAHIIDVYQRRFRGLAEYYQYAVDRGYLSKLKHVMEIALVKTLAAKYRISVKQVYRRYRGTAQVNGHQYRTLQVDVLTPKGTRRFTWGAFILRTVKPGRDPLNDQRYHNLHMSERSDLVRRLQATTCELCGTEGSCEVHHIRKLADLKKPGRKEKPAWMKRMIAMQRKTLIVCETCHNAIHAGRRLSHESR